MKRGLVEVGHPELSIARQCELMGLARSSWYYQAGGEGADNLAVMRRLDELYTAHPFYGVRRMTAALRQEGYRVNPKRVRRLLRVMGLEAIYPKPNLSQPHPAHRIYPYLLRGVAIERVNHVWSSDITYVRLRQGFVYLVAVIDWYSRYVIAWELSTTLDTEFCLVALERALRVATPTVFNTDQGAQFTSLDFTGRLLVAGSQVSMDGRGRALDNVFVERLWRSVKYEDLYLYDYETPGQVRQGLDRYFKFYNEQRLHQALGYRTPASIFFGF